MEVKLNTTVILPQYFAVVSYTRFLWPIFPRANLSPLWTGRSRSSSWTAQPGTDFVISKEALDEFKKIYLAEYGDELSDDVALELAINLLTFANAVYRPVKKSWLR